MDGLHTTDNGFYNCVGHLVFVCHEVQFPRDAVPTLHPPSSILYPTLVRHKSLTRQS